MLEQDHQRPKIKRGARACNACRKGKNRCDIEDRDPACRRCRNQGLECVFEQPSKQYTSEEERLQAVESTCLTLDAKVDRILELLASQPGRLNHSHGSFTSDHFPQNASDIPLYPSTSSLTLPAMLSSAPSAQVPLPPITHLPSGSMPIATIPVPTPVPVSEPFDHYQAQQQQPQTSSSIYNQSTVSPASSSNTAYTPGGGFAPVPRSSGSAKRGRGTASSTSIATYPAPRAHSTGPPSEWPKDPVSTARAERRASAGGPTNRKRSVPDEWPEPSASLSQGSKRLQIDPQLRLSPPAPPSSRLGEDESGPEGANLTMTAPFEALADAAALAAEGAPDPFSFSRTPTNGGSDRQSRSSTANNESSRNPAYIIRDVVSKGILNDGEARMLWKFYHEELTGFIAILDHNDSYEGIRESAPATFNAVMTISCRRHPHCAVSPQAKAGCKHEAEENARATLFGTSPTRDIVQAITLLSAWSFDHTYVSTGHALRLAIQLRMHQALGQLQRMSDLPEAPLPDREIVIAARTWLLLGWLDWQVSLGTGRPLSPHHEDGPLTEAKYNALLEHPSSLSGDIKLVSNNILMYHMHAISEATFGDPAETLHFVQETNARLEAWYDSWNQAFEMRRATFHQSSIKRQLYEAKTFLAARALENSTGMPPEDFKELVDLSVLACLAVLDACLKPKDSQTYSIWLRWASTPNFVEIAWGGIWVLQVLKLCPALERDRTDQVLERVQELATLMECWPAKRYSLTLKIALERFCRARSPTHNGSEEADAIVQDYDLNDLLAISPDQWAAAPGYAWFSEGLFGSGGNGPLHNVDLIQAWQGLQNGNSGGELFPLSW